MQGPSLALAGALARMARTANEDHFCFVTIDSSDEVARRITL